jgi:fumarate reductase subunit C
VFYGVFVTAVAVHAPIGLRAIIKEMTALPQRRVDLLCFIAAVLIGYLGYRVVGDFYRLGAIS